MARKPRIHYPGALYHVMVRGNNRESVLSGDTNKNKYLNTVALYKKKIGFMLYAYCIMDNHVHLLIEVNDIPLSKIMQRIQQVYTQWINYKHDRTGHVFQQRYKALLCNKEDYLFQLIKYIHNNPVKADLKQGIDYKWSSHIYYSGKQKNGIVDRSYILNMFSKNTNKAIEIYLKFMDQEEEEITYMDMDELKSVDQSAKKDNKQPIKEITVDEIIDVVCKNENITLDEITKKTKIQRISDIRKAIVILSEKYSIISNKLLAGKLNLSPSMISKIKSGSSTGTQYVEEIIDKYERVSK